MACKVVLLSCPIRGRLHSRERRADIAVARDVLKNWRRKAKNDREFIQKHGDVVFVAPYLLHAECASSEDDLILARADGAGWSQILPQEVWFEGDELCTGMRCDLCLAGHYGAKVVLVSDHLQYLKSLCRAA